MAAQPLDVKSIFGKALELTDPIARATFLDHACAGNSGMRAELDGLLAALDQAGGFLNRPPGADGSTATSAPVASTASFERVEPTGIQTVDHPGKDETLGTVIAGKYKLVEAIGEG